MESGLFTLGGVVVGATLSFLFARSTQHAQWMLDNRRQEYRELLNSITAAYMAIAHIFETEALGTKPSPEMDLLARRAEIDSFRTLRDRILIADEVELANALVEWDTAIQNFKRTHDERIFAQRFSSINKRLVEIARAPVWKPSLRMQLSSWRSSRKISRQR